MSGIWLFQLTERVREKEGGLLNIYNARMFRRIRLKGNVIRVKRQTLLGEERAQPPQPLLTNWKETRTSHL
jgi:hypothetical protein